MCTCPTMAIIMIVLKHEKKRENARSCSSNTNGGADRNDNDNCPNDISSLIVNKDSSVEAKQYKSVLMAYLQYRNETFNNFELT